MREVVLLGHPVAASLSPVFQNAGFEEVGLEALYKVLDVPLESLGEILSRDTGLAFLGANVTVPYKEAVLTWVEHCTEVVGVVQAANTLWRNAKGELVAGCTDVFGARVSVEHLAPLCGGAALVLGAGGAARSVVCALVEYASRAAVPLPIIVVCRDPGRVADSFSRLVTWSRGRGSPVEILPWSFLESGEMVGALWSRASLVVDATSVVTRSREAQLDIWRRLPWRHLREDAAVLDLSVRPVPTVLQELALERGLSTARVMDGACMLLHQGLLSWRGWFPGEHPPTEVMRTALATALRRSPAEIPLVVDRLREEPF